MLGQVQEQRQLMSAAMQQSMKILQLPLLSLQEYLNELATENPMLDVDAASLPAGIQAEPARPVEDKVWKEEIGDDIFERRVKRRADSADISEYADLAAPGETFTQQLHDQLNSDRSIPKKYLPLAHFIVESLNARGYLDESLEEIADLTGAPLCCVQQALYIVQDLTPTGVGARSLQECLVLQLAQSHSFNAATLKVVNECLPLLAKDDLGAIAKRLGVSKAEAKRACDAVRALNPIPSRGYPGGESTAFTVPEAVVQHSEDGYAISYNRAALPKVSVNPEYEQMMKESEGEVQSYLRENHQKARRLLQDLDYREGTITKVLRYVLTAQDAFLSGRSAGPAPLTLQEIADALGLHPSTISRAVKDKTILFNGKTLPLRELFSTPVTQGGASRGMALRQLKRLIDAEDPHSALSDDALASALRSLGINVSRRTVAAYRQELEIPSAAVRKRRAAEGGQ